MFPCRLPSPFLSVTLVINLPRFAEYLNYEFRSDWRWYEINNAMAKIIERDFQTDKTLKEYVDEIAKDERMLAYYYEIKLVADLDGITPIIIQLPSWFKVQNNMALLIRFLRKRSLQVEIQSVKAE